MGFALCDAMIIPAWFYSLMDVTFFVDDWSMKIYDGASTALLRMLSAAELVRVALAQESRMLRASSASGIAGVQVDLAALQAETETAGLRLLEEGDVLPPATTT